MKEMNISDCTASVIQSGFYEHKKKLKGFEANVTAAKEALADAEREHAACLGAMRAIFDDAEKLDISLCDGGRP